MADIYLSPKHVPYTILAKINGDSCDQCSICKKNTKPRFPVTTKSPEEDNELVHCKETQTPSIQPFSEIEKITLVVDKKKFTLNRELLVAHPETMLGRMFGSGILLAKPNDDGEYEVASGISAEVFEAILAYYDGAFIHCPASVSLDDVQKACDYLMIPFNGDTVRCSNLGLLVKKTCEERSVTAFSQFFLRECYTKALEAGKKYHWGCIFIVLSEQDVIHHYEPSDSTAYSIPEYCISNEEIFQFLLNPVNVNLAEEIIKQNGFEKFKISMRSLKQCYSTNYNYKCTTQNRPFIELCWLGK